MGLKANVSRALRSPPVRWVNFVHKNRGIAPIAFYRLAVHVSNGTIGTKIDSSIQGRMAYYDQNTNTMIASDNDFGSHYWDEKALLIHEAAHAILDKIYAGKDSRGKRAPMRVVDDEIIGYLAGAFYLVAANASGASRSAPEREALKIARSKLNPRKPWDGCLTFTFTAKELRPLHNAISNDPLYRSVASQLAVHNG